MHAGKHAGGEGGSMISWWHLFLSRFSPACLWAFALSWSWRHAGSLKYHDLQNQSDSQQITFISTSNPNMSWSLHSQLDFANFPTSEVEEPLDLKRHQKGPKTMICKLREDRNLSLPGGVICFCGSHGQGAWPWSGGVAVGSPGQNQQQLPVKAPLQEYK